MSHETPVEDLLLAVGLDPNVNVPSEIYRNIRNKALEEAAKVCAKCGWKAGISVPTTEFFMDAIRALKVEE